MNPPATNDGFDWHPIIPYAFFLPLLFGLDSKTALNKLQQESATLWETGIPEAEHELNRIPNVSTLKEAQAVIARVAKYGGETPEAMLAKRKAALNRLRELKERSIELDKLMSAENEQLKRPESLI